MRIRDAASSGAIRNCAPVCLSWPDTHRGPRRLAVSPQLMCQDQLLVIMILCGLASIALGSTMCSTPFLNDAATLFS